MGRTGRIKCRKRDGLNNENRPVTCAENDSIIKLRHWMKDQSGFKCDLIPANFKTTGRGVMTKKKVNTGSTLISLPSKLLITTTTVLQSDIGYHIKHWTPKLTPQQCISVYLIWEKFKEEVSFWQPYINTLPECFTTPAFFSQKELSFLTCSVRDQAIAEVQKVQEKYKEVARYSTTNWPEFNQHLTFSRFRWAWYVINTRSVYLHSETSIHLSQAEPDNIALAPFLDLFNHSSNANITAGLNTANGCYEIQSFDTYNPFEQVFISYGAHCNRKLFLDYGFCISNNYQDEFEVSTDVLMTMADKFKIENRLKKCQILRENNLLNNLTCSRDGLSWKFLVVIRTLFMNWHELKCWNAVYSEERHECDLCHSDALQLVKCILKFYLDENRNLWKHVVTEKCDTDHADHIGIALQLIDIEKCILEQCLSKCTC